VSPSPRMHVLTTAPSPPQQQLKCLPASLSQHACAHHGALASPQVREEDPEEAARREAAAARLHELEALVEEQRTALEQGAAGQRALELHISELEARLRQVSDQLEAF